MQIFDIKERNTMDFREQSMMNKNILGK